MRWQRGKVSVLTDDEKFYDFQSLVDVYRPKVLALFSRIRNLHPDVSLISVFGEMFGGRYAHESVPAVKGTILIQKGMDYTPAHEFYGFDIYLFEGDSGRYLSVDEVNKLFEAEGFFYARTLMSGSLVECLKYSNAFQSKISQWLGFPDIDDNICEGVVIRPVEPQYLRNGSRVLIKSKNARFAEKKSVKKRNKLFAEPVPYSDALKALLPEVEAYVNENRLNNVVSHIGEVTFPKDFGNVMGLFAKDILDDFLKEHGGEYSALDKCEQKSLNRELNKLATDFVKQTFMSKAYIID
ncbi:RNA ligase family protein [uncultured Muribaculum sp.]|uniref:RNA ligase family protein n=1 Tax=uncultured Muribaculum sp. TaxID=1918613 RepID=UPI0025D19C73|nr:RNA ligase family protein [uncultured Muribaculum sp.]